MENVEAQAPASKAPVTEPKAKNGPQTDQKRNVKRKQPQHSAEIVFTKGASIQTLPALSKQLKDVTDCIIGLHYVWEYRSPSKSVPPHYQCKLCQVSRLQHDMIAHVKGWRHSFRYMKKVHPDKVKHEEEEAVKDPAVRKAIKGAAAEVEKMEGRGQLKVVLKEPSDVPAFKGLRSAVPKYVPQPPPGMGLSGIPFGPRFSEPRFPGEFPGDFPGEFPPPPAGGPLSDYPGGDSQWEYGLGGYSGRQDSLDSGMNRRPFPDSMGPPRPAGLGDNYGSSDRRSGPLEDNPGRRYSDEYRGGQMGSSLMDKTLERPGLMGTSPESSNLPNTLLTYLDTFRIENESDAQLVLKVTQKLTDVLMEYRLRSVSTGSSLSSFSLNSTGFSSSISSFSRSSDRFSSSLSGPSRYSSGPSRYYK
ncbi:uncharacterized protein si:ch211-197h24.6 [Plectropomus leopardus]|uniref:uncharacterized protein si:ch211-197h24.6 n=1 Tax=Plectropomus leopardus TaxID=160734 RepID=UPI001C4D7E4C|nr:uncharacterized protein si:ch211-197h24.6 [Plectropomus leopardus]